MVVHRQHGGVGTDQHRPGARHRVSARRERDGRLLRRRSARRQSVRREPCRRRSADREAQVALPARAPRHLGSRHPVRADSGRHQATTAKPSRLSRSRPSRRSSMCSIASRGSRSGRLKSARCRRVTCLASTTRRRSRFPLDGRGRPFNYDRQGFVDDDLIDFTPELRAEGVKSDLEVQVRAHLHAAGCQQGRRSARHAHAGGGWRRDELAGRIVRSGDEHSLCELAESPEPARARAAARSVEERSRVCRRQRADRREDDRRYRLGGRR